MGSLNISGNMIILYETMEKTKKEARIIRVSTLHKHYYLISVSPPGSQYIHFS